MNSQRKCFSGESTTPTLSEYSLGSLSVVDDTPVHRVFELLQPRVLKAILCVRHGFDNSLDLEDVKKVVECRQFYIGRSQARYHDRSRLQVTYRLMKPTLTSRRDKQGGLSRWRSLYAWIGRGSAGGVSLYWRERC